MRRALRLTSRAGDIKFGCGLDETSAAPYASEVRSMWGNLPRHIRRSFKRPSKVENLGAPAGTDKLSQSNALTVRTKQTIVDALGSWAPQTWQTLPIEYAGIPLKPYKEGQTAAYHYPSILIPRYLSNRMPMDMDVEPVFQTSDASQIIRTKQTNFFFRLQDKVTCLLMFSGQPLSGLWTGVQQWRELWDKLPKSSDAQLLRLHMCDSWWSRRTSSLTKFTLRRQVETHELFETFVYRGKWTTEIVRTMPYNQDLPSILLVDRYGYIRWHAVGLPTQEAIDTVKPLIQQLMHEKRQ